MGARPIWHTMKRCDLYRLQHDRAGDPLMKTPGTVQTNRATSVELGPGNLDKLLKSYIWNGRPHIRLKDLWEYHNRYLYMPRLKNRDVLVRTVKSAIGGLVPGLFAYAEGWDEPKQEYKGLLIDNAASAIVTIDDASLLVRPDVARKFRPQPSLAETAPRSGSAAGEAPAPLATAQVTASRNTEKPQETQPTRFYGTVAISPDRPARDIRQVLEAIVEQLTTIPGSDVSIKLEINAEVPAGLDRNKVRTLVENANTLGFIDKDIS